VGGGGKVAGVGVDGVVVLNALVWGGCPTTARPPQRKNGDKGGAIKLKTSGEFHESDYAPQHKTLSLAPSTSGTGFINRTV